MIAQNDPEGKTTNNLYYDKPLVVLTYNGAVVVPARLKISVTIPEISNENNIVTCDVKSLTRKLDMNTTGHMFGIFLKVDYIKDINKNIANEDKKRNYIEVEDSGFEAQLYQILNNKQETEICDYPGSVELKIDIEAMDIKLPEPPSGKTYRLYAAHNHEETAVEYLPISLSSDKTKGTIKVSTLSPFAIVYKESRKVEPSDTSYKIPITGD